MTDLEKIELAAYRAEARLNRELHHAVAREHGKAFRVFAEEVFKFIREERAALCTNKGGE